MTAPAKDYLSCAETAKLLRGVLKAEFPGVQFSVRSKTYAGGASITARWTDGPTAPAVQTICDRYRGADFDGMIDLKSYRDSILVDPDGEPHVVHFGADFIFAEREYSQPIVDGVAQLIAQLAEQPCDLSREGYGMRDGSRSYPLNVIRYGGEIGRMVRMADGHGAEMASTLVHQWLHDKDVRGWSDPA